MLNDRVSALHAALFFGLLLAWSGELSAQPAKTDKPAQAQDKGKKVEAQAQEKGKKAGEGQKQTSVVVLVPPVLVLEENYANGCWVRLYDEENFRGEFLTLVGPADVLTLRTPTFNLVRTWQSVMVGPRATVAAYDNENLTQKVINFKPNQRVADLDPKLGFFENIRSLRINCSK